MLLALTFVLKYSKISEGIFREKLVVNNYCSQDHDFKIGTGYKKRRKYDEELIWVKDKDELHGQ